MIVDMKGGWKVKNVYVCGERERERECVRERERQKGKTTKIVIKTVINWTGLIQNGSEAVRAFAASASRCLH